MTRPDVLGKVVQSLFALGFSSVALWGRAVFDEDVKYAYLLDPPYIYQAVAVSLALVFAPQILHFFHWLWRHLVSGAFFAFYRARRQNYVPALAVGIAAVSLAVGAVALANGGARYAFSVIREIKYHDAVYHGRLIALANEQDLGPGIADALPTIDRIVELYPDHWANERMVRWSTRVRNAIELSDTLLARADKLADSAQYLRSIAFARASLDVWPENQGALARLRDFRDALAAAEPALEDLFEQCAQTFSPLQTDQSAWKFVVAAPVVGQDFSSLPEGERSRLTAQLCSQPLDATDASDFIGTIRRTAFGDDA